MSDRGGPAQLTAEKPANAAVAWRRAAFSWDGAVLLALAATIGIYAGIAAGLFASCIRFVQIVLFRFPELSAAIFGSGREWRVQLGHKLAAAPWHPEFAVLAAVLVMLSLGVSALAERRSIRVPVFEAHRLRAAGLAGAFGLSLFYPLVLLTAFNGTFHEGDEGLFGVLRAAPLWLRVLAPAFGGLLAGFVVRLVPESGGHGVVEVIEAVHSGSGKLRARVALWKSVGAGLVIGSGGSAGREGPTVHVGASVAAGLSRLLALPRETASLLFACGAGAGIAASFQAPLAGTMFALEIVLGDFGARRFAPIVLASVTATVTARALLGGGAELRPVAWQLAHPSELALHLLLGALAGGLAIVYVRTNHGLESLFAGHGGGRLGRWLSSRPIELRLAIGGLGVGLLSLLAPRAMGTGIESMNAALAGQLTFAVLAVALVVKLAATGLTLGSGAPGGSFFPAVFLGAMLGGGFGQLVHRLLPAYTAGPEAYAAIGMGAVVAGATAAPLTGILIMFELTGSYQIVLPLLVACGFAAAIVHGALGGGMYALKARARGVRPAGDSPLRELSVAEAVERVEPLREDLGWLDLVRRVADSSHAAFPVVSAEGALVGLLSVREVRAALMDPSLAGLAVARDFSRQAPRLMVDDSLEHALAELRRASASEAAVLEAPKESAGEPAAIGVLTREAILEAWRRASDAG